MTLISIWWLSLAHAYSRWLDLKGAVQYFYLTRVDDLLHKP